MEYLKFGFIVFCLLITVYYKKPFAALFTAAADYFLIILMWNEIGVTVFAAAHLCYIVRFSGSKRNLLYTPLFIIPALIAAWLTGESNGYYLTFISAIYAQCFALALFFAFKGFFGNRFPRKNGVLIVLGMSLFALCDICVLIFNLNHGAAGGIAFNLIWVFYAPSQLLLALSANGCYSTD